MSVLYLIRHGQAGTRDDYDSLSEMGRVQARLLGEHFRAQGIQFAAAYSGSLARQKATAAEALPDGEIRRRCRIPPSASTPDGMSSIFRTCIASLLHG